MTSQVRLLPAILSAGIVLFGFGYLAVGRAGAVDAPAVAPAVSGIDASAGLAGHRGSDRRRAARLAASHGRYPQLTSSPSITRAARWRGCLFRLLAPPAPPFRMIVLGRPS